MAVVESDEGDDEGDEEADEVFVDALEAQEMLCMYGRIVAATATWRDGALSIIARVSIGFTFMRSASRLSVCITTEVGPVSCSVGQGWTRAFGVRYRNRHYQEKNT